MSSLRLDERLQGALAPLAPYARHLVERSAAHAHRIHAEELSLPHLLTTLMLDEACAAHRALVHLFADPETIATECLALSPGVLVVGSGRSLPFSVLGARSLEAARDLAVQRGAGAVAGAHLLAAAAAVLEGEPRAALDRAGYRVEGLDEALEDCAESEPLSPTGPLLHGFTTAAMRSCGVAARIAVQLGRESISPVHLVFAVLETEPELQEAAGLGLMRTRAAFTGRDADLTPPEPRLLAGEKELLSFLASTPPGVDSLGLLLGILQRGTQELRLLLGQHLLSPEALGEAQTAYRDPAPPIPGPSGDAGTGPLA